MCRDVAGRVPTHLRPAKTFFPVILPVDSCTSVISYAASERLFLCAVLPFSPYRVANRSDDGEKNSVYIVICGANNGAGIGKILKVARLLGWR